MSDNSTINSDFPRFEPPFPSGASHGMQASAALLVISAVALTVIYFMNPAAATLQMGVWGTVGGVALTTFVVSALMHIRAKRQQGEKIEIPRPAPQLIVIEYQTFESAASSSHREEKEAIASTHAEVAQEPEAASIDEPPEVVVAQPDNPVTLVRDAIIPPLMEALRNAVTAMTTAHARLTRNKVPEAQQIEVLFQEGTELMQICMDKPELYLSELLICFGRGKNKPSVALRRLVTAHNGGDPVKCAEVQRQYEAIMRGNRLADVAAILKSTEPNTQILARFPEIMENHFCVDDPDLQVMGMELLRKIFPGNPNPKVNQALTSLKKRAPRPRCSSKEMAAFAKEVEKFLQVAFEQAQIPEAEMTELSGRLVDHMMANQFMQNMKKMLGMLARNIRLLPSMFADSVNTRQLFPQIDETFLLSESGDCLGENEETIKKLLAVQSAINYDRAEAKRVALLLPGEGSEEIIQLCKAANQGQYREQELQRLAQRPDVQALGEGVIVVPVSISDHGFKQIRSKLNAVPNWLLRTLYTVISGFIPGLVKPPLFEMLPELDENNRKRFEAFIDQLMGLLMPAIYDGSINNSSKFREPFEKVITTQGEVLANRLEEMANRADAPTFEEIRDVWVEAVGLLEQGFKELYEQ